MAAALTAKAATATIPIVFGLSQDPIRFGLVASFPRSGGNATGINFLNRRTRCQAIGTSAPAGAKAAQIGPIINSANTPVNAESTTQKVQEFSRALGLQIHGLQAGTSQEIDRAFGIIARERLEALFVVADAFFFGRRVQFATSAARDRIPTTYPDRESVEAGWLMSYGVEIADVFYQVGVYSGPFS